MDGDEDILGSEEDNGPGHNIPVWQITLADMCMLLMSFFIFLYALSATNPQGVSDTLESVRQRLSAEAGAARNVPRGQPSHGDVLDQAALREQLILHERQVYEDLSGYFKGRGETTMHTKLTGARITISFPSDPMFSRTDPSVLTDFGKERIGEVADFMAKHPDQRVNVRGFTDDTPPPPQSRFKDNWELSSAQAVAALRQLMSLGVPPNRLTSTGLADLEPLLPNTSDENRSRNRRLEFVLEVQVGNE